MLYGTVRGRGLGLMCTWTPMIICNIRIIALSALILAGAACGRDASSTTAPSQPGSITVTAITPTLGSTGGDTSVTITGQGVPTRHDRHIRRHDGQWTIRQPRYTLHYSVPANPASRRRGGGHCHNRPNAPKPYASPARTLSRHLGPLISTDPGRPFLLTVPTEYCDSLFRTIGW